MTQPIRNIAIIAHVDHGKTTLIDAMLRQSGTFRDNQQVDERIMDSNDLEKERGITILAKCTAVDWEETRINIIDTPGHADFGGEVERVLQMVDGVLLLVDSAEGPMPQTKFVLSKALALGLKPIVIINKIDRPDGRPDEVIDEVFDLFVALDANEEQLDFPIMYASGRDGWCAENPEGPKENLTPLFTKILAHVALPDVDRNAPFSMLATILTADPYLGRMLTGRVLSGVATVNMPVQVLNLDGEVVEKARLSKLLRFHGVETRPADAVEAGDIVCIAGLEKATVADTIASPEITQPITAQPVDPPTMAVTIGVNDSPLAGQDGDKVTSRLIRDRLLKEAESNVAITVTETEQADRFEVGGRGELQLGVLIETMRREGFELSVSRPRVLLREEHGEKQEPIEEVVIDVDEGYSGTVVDSLNQRKGDMQEMKPSGGGKVRLVYHVPSRGLIGYQSQFLTETRGTGVMHRLFHDYALFKGEIKGRNNGVLIAHDKGKAVAYALAGLEERGELFVEPGTDVYQGMLIGEHSRGNDLDVNVLKAKQLTNFRASGSDENIRLSPPRLMTLEAMIAYIEDDELVEVTPSSLRLRKRYLDPHERKRQAKTAA